MEHKRGTLRKTVLKNLKRAGWNYYAKWWKAGGVDTPHLKMHQRRTSDYEQRNTPHNKNNVCWECSKEPISEIYWTCMSKSKHNDDQENVVCEIEEAIPSRPMDQHLEDVVCLHWTGKTKHEVEGWFRCIGWMEIRQCNSVAASMLKEEKTGRVGGCKFRV